MAVKRKSNLSYGLGEPLISMSPEPIVAQRAPTNNDFAEIGTIWIDQPLNDSYILTSVVANAATWINAGGGGGVFNTLVVTTTATIGTTLDVGTALTVGTTLEVTGNTTLNTGLGVVQSSAAGLITASDGTDGQVLIASTGAGAPAWATLTAGGGIAIADAAGAITISNPGATGTSFGTDVLGPVVPDGAGLTTLDGGTNITTDGTVANIVTFDLDDDVTLAGFLTAGVDLTMSTGDCTISANSNAAQTIYLHANGGILETIDIHADQGTDLASIYIHSDVGGLLLDAGIASADALTITASDIAGGIVIESGTTGTTLDSTGAITLGAAAASNFIVTGAFPLDFESTLGTVYINGGEAVAGAIQLTASDAVGGVTIRTGTGGIELAAADGIVALTSGTAAINIGTDAASHVVTVGSTNTASQTVIQSGTGDVTVTSTDDITIDATGSFSIDALEASNVTVTGAGLDLSLQGVGGAVNMTSDQAENDAIYIEASAANGGVQINAGTGGILIGNEVDCTGITLGLVAPTASRDITIGGGTIVTAAVTDTIHIGIGGATTNANSIKTVNINTGGVAIGEVLTHIATGAITSGTHTVNIQSGNAAAGTVVANVSTGTGTKIVNVGNADGLTTVNIDAITLINDSINVATSINTGASTGTVSIGNAAAGAMTIDTAAGISLDAATASNFTVTGAADLTLQSTLGGVDIISALAAADAIVLNASDAAGGIDADAGSGGFILTIANGPLTATTGTGQVDISADATANTVNIGTGAGIKNVTLGSGNTSSITDIACGTLGCTVGTTANEHTTTIGSNITASAITCVSGTGIAAFGANATDHTTTLGSVTGTSATTLQGGTGALNITSTSGTLTMNSGTGAMNIASDATANTLNIGTGGGVKAVTLGSVNTTSSVLIQSGSGDVSVTSTDDITLGATGDLSLDGATVDINGTAGATSVTPGTGSVAGTSLTLDARVFVATFTGQTTGAGADLDIDITNSFASAGIGVIITVSNQGANDADILCEGVNTHTAGHIILHCINAGPAALNGNVTVTGWVIN